MPRNDGPIDRPEPTYVYFAHIGDYIKVGYSGWPPNRVRQIMCNGGGVASPRWCAHSVSAFWAPREPLHSLRYTVGGLQDERAAHEALEDFGVIGEWFIAEPAVHQWIERVIRAEIARPFERLVREGGPYEREQHPIETYEQRLVDAALGRIFKPKAARA